MNDQMSLFEIETKQKEEGMGMFGYAKEFEKPALTEKVIEQALVDLEDKEKGLVHNPIPTDTFSKFVKSLAKDGYVKTERKIDGQTVQTFKKEK